MKKLVTLSLAIVVAISAMAQIRQVGKALEAGSKARTVGMTVSKTVQAANKAQNVAQPRVQPVRTNLTPMNTPNLKAAQALSPTLPPLNIPQTYSVVENQNLLLRVVERDFKNRETGVVPFVADSVSENRKAQLTDFAGKIAPYMIPIINIAYRADDADKSALYRVAADSIANGAVYSPDVEDIIFSVLYEEMSAEQ